MRPGYLLTLICLSFFVSFIILSCTETAGVTVQVKNPLAIERAHETITLDYSALLKKMAPGPGNTFQVSDPNSGQTIASQLIDLDGDQQYEELIFQATLAPLETRTFVIQMVDTASTASPESKVYARFVPERKDDFAWENDCIAYRMYGPALQADGEISSGVDVWVKSVAQLILDKWYQPGNDYHADHGEGLDYYKVGPSRGCGGLAPWDGEKLVPSGNYSGWKILANGPIRTVFELSYAPWGVGDKQVSEVKRISLDAGHHLNRFESTFSAGDDPAAFDIAIGLVKRSADISESVAFDPANGWLGYWEPAHEKHGSTGCGIVIAPSEISIQGEIDDHYLLITKVRPGEPLVYYAGAGWSKGAYFTDAAGWQEYLENFARRANSPLEVQIR